MARRVGYGRMSCPSRELHPIGFRSVSTWFPVPPSVGRADPELSDKGVSIAKRKQPYGKVLFVDHLATAAELSREQFFIELSMNRVQYLSGGSSSQAGTRLFERKNAMDDEIDDLWREVQRLTSEARTIRPEASNWLDDAATTIDDGKLWERVRYSRGLIGNEDREYVKEFEAETTRIVEELQRELQGASRSLQSLPTWSPAYR